MVVSLLIDSKNLTSVSGRNTTHVVMDGGQDRDGLLANIHSSKDAGSLRDTRETLSKNVGGQMAQLEVDVVLLRANTTAVAYLHSHGPGDDITTGKILGGRGISLHETLTLRVEEISTLTTSTLSDQAASSVNTRGVELDELEILVGKTGTSNHGHSVTGAGMGGCAAEVSASVSASRKDGVVGQETVESSILLVVGQHTTALTVLHDQVNSEVLNEVVGVVPEGLAVERVKESMAGTVSGGAAAVGLATLAELLGLSTERTLVAVDCSPSASNSNSNTNTSSRFTGAYIFPSSVLEKGQP